MEPNENLQGGYAVDGAIMYGPSRYRGHMSSGGAEPGVATEHPFNGPTQAGAQSLPTPRQFISSPVGITLLLLAAGYALYVKVFA